MGLKFFFKDMYINHMYYIFFALRNMNLQQVDSNEKKWIVSTLKGCSTFDYIYVNDDGMWQAGNILKSGKSEFYCRLGLNDAHMHNPTAKISLSAIFESLQNNGMHMKQRDTWCDMKGMGIS